MIDPNRYEEELTQTLDRIEILKGRVARFEAKGITGRDEGIKTEIELLESFLPSLRGTAKLAGELFG